MFSLPFQYIPHHPQLFALLAYSHRLSTTFLSPPPSCNKVWLFYPLLQTHGAKDCNYFFLIHFLLLEKNFFFQLQAPSGGSITWTMTITDWTKCEELTQTGPKRASLRTDIETHQCQVTAKLWQQGRGESMLYLKLQWVRTTWKVR